MELRLHYLGIFSALGICLKSFARSGLRQSRIGLCDWRPTAKPGGPKWYHSRLIIHRSLARKRDLCNKKLSSKTVFQRCVGKGGDLRMGKRIVLLSGTTLFALMLTFAGCGKREEPAPPPPPPPAPAPAAPAPAEPPAPSGEMKAPADQPSGGAPMEKMPMEKKDEGTKTK